MWTPPIFAPLNSRRAGARATGSRTRIVRVVDDRTVGDRADGKGTEDATSQALDIVRGRGGSERDLGALGGLGGSGPGRRAPQDRLRHGAPRPRGARTQSATH